MSATDRPGLRGKTLFVTGASRGIGLAIALRAAQDGANVVIAAKTAEPHPKLPGTIHTAAAEIEAAGGRALPLVVDIRHEDQVLAAVEQALARFGGIDICVNNASAISKTGTLATDMKRFDLMHGINARGTYLVTRACLPHLLKAANPHVLMLSPPLNMEERWFAPNVAYTMAKFGMSLCVLGMAGEFRDRVAFNALWPKTVIGTAAVNNLLGGDAAMKRTRHPRIVADAAHHILTSPVGFSGNFCVDEAVLRAAGRTDFSAYGPADDELMPDVFL
ncbi:NAD(P)-dependent oxidoreductase [Piscinibacter sakaiensis]|uniref:Short-chain dehydrogenase/reductase SDR n=1 Tax=Piscinibacter sakaiensis TaxID=1547922 RepID=A0A0K8P6D9_PISS1|nr:NAD(P)-dependent oxidoreductase [Piscinibacter sakaiensis]GAP38104.1 short-chain dehydrogenase/reductase SDR [Piscinibacter sakaiensis]